jgi:hypothetical protein
MVLTVLIQLFILISFTPSALGAFGDVPDGHWSYDYVMVIYNAQITAGCGAANYCPVSDVTRGQMAAFIIRALYGENFLFPLTPYFSDVPSNHVFFKYVQKLKEVGITAQSGVYGVDSPVTREQMAAFIIRARFGDTFAYTTMPYFSDVPSSSVFFKYVQKLKDETITVSSGAYMAGSSVTREQMAAFLYRAFLRHLYGLAPDIMAKLAILDGQVTNAQITEEQFLTGFLEALGQLETHGISLFLQYLETNVSGFPINYPAPAGREAAESMTIQETVDAITQSQAYQMLEAFISSVIGSLTPEPASTLLQLARPETFVALSAIQVRSHIDKAFYNESSITFDQYQDCLAELSQNPYDAERKLLQYQGKPIPAWLTPAPVTSGCLRNCPPPPPPPGYCGDGVCDPALGESTITCPGDCPPPPGYCGDGTCDPGLGESTVTCPGDCPLVCGDGFCNIAGGELQSCPSDCPQNQCCAQTNGCPSETPYDCPGSCCCCGWGQTCCQTTTGWTCCGG